MPTAIVGFNASDGSEDALALACTLQRDLDYDIVVVAAAADPLERLGGRYTAQVRREADEALATARSMVDDDLELTYESRHGTSAAHVLCDAAVHHGADVLVVGSTHHRASSEMFAPSVTHRAIREAPCAVAIPPAGFRAHSWPHLRRLAVGYDGSPEALAALRRAIGIARETNARLAVLHAFHLVLAAAPAGSFAYADPSLLRDMRHAAHDELARGTEIVRQEAPDIEVREALLSGDPAERLIEASERADLLLLGSHGYGRLRRGLVGSVSGRVVRHARCPVLVVPRAAAAAVTRTLTEAGEQVPAASR